jgi:hypothetical protein
LLARESRGDGGLTGGVDPGWLCATEHSMILG